MTGTNTPIAHPTVAGADLEPGVSVIVPSYRGRDRIVACLRSLTAQSLDPKWYEVIVILNGEADGTRAVLERHGTAHPELSLRVLEQPTAGASRARNAGIAAAARRHVTFVDDDDTVSPGYLEVLLAHAGPDLIPFGQIIDVGDDGSINPDNPINLQTIRHSGRSVHPTAVPRALGFNACKLLPTEMARSVSYDTALRSGVDVAYFMALLARHDFLIHVCPVSSRPGARNAVYYRSLRPGSMSRQVDRFEFNVIGRMEVIARIRALLDTCSDERKRQVMLTTISSQAGFIARYLDSRPDSYREVLAAVESYGIENFPYYRLTKGLARSLVVSFCFPPYNGTSGVVMAKRVRERGEVVDVVYNAMDSVRDIDPTTKVITRGLVDREIKVQAPNRFSHWPAIETFCESGLAAIESSAPRYQRLYSRVTWPASHILAALYKISHPDVRWSAEFSDPLSRNVSGELRTADVVAGPLLAQLTEALHRNGAPLPRTHNALQWCEHMAFALADEVIFTNANQRDYMLSYVDEPELVRRVRERAIICPQPCLPDRFYHLVPSPYEVGGRATVHLAYFGAFYSNRSLDDVLTAVGRLPSTEQRSLKLHVFTNAPERLRERAEALGAGPAVRVSPYVGYLEFLNLTTRFDWLIVNDAVTAGTHSRNPYLPSKLADYQGSGTPIWGIVEPGSPLSDAPLGHVTEVGDVEAARSFLEHLVSERCAGLSRR